LLTAAAASTPRRVGDGGEYFVMSLQLAGGGPPALSREELSTFRQRLARIGSGFETSLLEYPDLIGNDGRQDFLHFFLYPLIVAPAVPAVGWFGLHPNWAFTLVNAFLLSAAVFVVASRAPLVAVVAGFVGPIIWWVDKAHTEAFLFAAVSVAAVILRQQPGTALILYALAGAQNAAIGLTYPIFAAIVWFATRRLSFNPRTWLAAAAGAVVVAAPFLYTWIRLDRYSLMADYAQPAIPSPGGIAAFVFDPNIGLLPNAPVFALVMAAAGWLLILRVRSGPPLPVIWWWPAIIQLVLLVVWSQNPNANHGGTPGLNRWTLSLLAIGLPWIADVRAVLSRGPRSALNILVAVICVLTAAAHLPSTPENYRAPTSLAVQVWQSGWMHVTPAEVFAERAQGREPAFAPSHDGSCRILLIADQHAPVNCPPPVEPLPAWCRQPSAMCYALVAADTVKYVRAPVNGFFYRVPEFSWPAAGPLAAGVHRVLREADPGARVWRVDTPRRWRERFGVEVGVVLTTPNVTVIHIPRVAEHVRQTLAADESLHLVPLILEPWVMGREQWTNLAVIVKRESGR
jgi:hypothetical protein